MMRFFLPFIGLILFFLEPVFGLLSPLQFGGEAYTIVPRFLLMYLIFVAIYYDRKHAMYYGLFFGLLYDVFFIDIIGLYSFLYPAIALVAGSVVRSIHKNLAVATGLALILTALFEFVLYQFFLLISLTSLPVDFFLVHRLMPTIIANSIFLIMLGWTFKLAINARLLERDRRLGTS
ncbi:rod shape-determining protein MreD [Planomicrobium sp. YIM 101495]|uniref:rod shape-determining protein MreD n=1 Tax=Planomicrobium sp. YIM 101495 TaxID=2665160 RepID=UPI0012B9523D|nr:rod shape-determining protein MreD [Planomicrobium sp. YIM 101495]MTD29685.1 rod shape-determining protein MreD [Planomicrobium sp. YIM 101495]